MITERRLALVLALDLDNRAAPTVYFFEDKKGHLDRMYSIAIDRTGVWRGRKYLYDPLKTRGRQTLLEVNLHSSFVQLFVIRIGAST